MPTEDRHIVEEVLSGRPEAFAELVRRHHPKIIRLCRTLLSPPASAEDAAQEVFIKGYRSLKGFQGSSSFSSWLYRIASNHCMDLMRKVSRERTDSWEALVEKKGERMHALLRESGSVQASLEHVELLDAMLSGLPPEQRAALTLRELQGLSYQEIAVTLGCSVDSVKARLRRARQQIVERLRHFSEPGNV